MLKQANIEQLSAEHWVAVPEDPEVELALIPAEAPEAAILLNAGMDESAMRRFCTKAFVGFKGFLDENDNPVANTLTARMQLMSWVPARRTAMLEIGKLNEAIAAGEGDGGSD